MTKDEIISRLRQHRNELEAAGIEHISIFGSVARGEDNPDSDLDLAIHFSDPVMKSGFSFFSTLEDVRERLQVITGVPSVDIVAEPVEKERLRHQLDRDRAIAF